MANDDPAEQLKKLSELRAQGVLSEAEFTAAKAKVLGSTDSSKPSVTPTGIAAALGFAAVIIGSIGPWATSPLSSASGFDGDGKITAIAGVIGLVLIAGKRPGFAPLMALVAIGAIDIALADVAGVQAVHVTRGAGSALLSIMFFAVAGCVP